MYDALLFAHLFGLALGLGTALATFTLGRAARELPPDERARFVVRTYALGRNASAGLALLLASGLGMLFTRGVATTFAAGGAALHAKLGLVAVLIGLFGYLQVQMKRARQAGAGPALERAALAGRLVLATTTAIVAAAVLAFH